MDVLLLHCQPHSPPRLLAGLLSCLAALAAAHPAQLLPFTQSGLAAAAALADTLKAGEMRAALCRAVAGLCTGATAPSQEADTLYTVIFPGWAGQARELVGRVATLHAVAALTPFLSDGLVRERAPVHIPALIGLYKKSGTSAQVDPSKGRCDLLYRDLCYAGVGLPDRASVPPQQGGLAAAARQPGAAAARPCHPVLRPARLPAAAGGPGLLLHSTALRPRAGGSRDITYVLKEHF